MSDLDSDGIKVFNFFDLVDKYLSLLYRMPAPEATSIMQDTPTIVQPDFTIIDQSQGKYGIYEYDGSFKNFKEYITLKLSGQSITSYQDFLRHVGNLKTIKNDKNVPVFSSTIDYESIYKALYPDNTDVVNITDEEKKSLVGGKQKRQRKTRKSKKSRKPRKTHRRRM